LQPNAQNFLPKQWREGKRAGMRLAVEKRFCTFGGGLAQLYRYAQFTNRPFPDMKELLKKLLNVIRQISPIPLSKNHLYDRLTQRIIRTRLRPNSNCVDVGCFKGEILDLILRAAPQGRHFGLEPIPTYYEALVQKYRGQPQCSILNFAASNVAETTSFNHVVSNPAYSGLRQRDYQNDAETLQTITVKTDMLDHLIPTDIPIALIKIDVEGAEMLVLEGARALISKYKPMVVFECGKGAARHYGTTPQQVFAYFAELGMKLSSLKAFIGQKPPFSEDEFVAQYEQELNYYFIAYD
jgi:FkbM family methyltransferase